MTTLPRLEAPPAPAEQAAPPRKRAYRPHPVGVVVAAWFLLGSLTPGLVPRSWYLHGVTSGLAAAYGYALGIVATWAVRRVAAAFSIRVTADPVRVRRVRITCWTVLGTVVVLVWLWSLSWQQEAARLVGGDEPGWSWLLLSGLCAAATLNLLLLLGHGLRAVVLRGARRLPLRPLVAVPLAALLVAGFVMYVGELGRREAGAWIAERADVLNASTPAGREPPTSPLRSGGPGSPEPWETLGRNGKAFVADGADAARISAATGRPALEPIRVYAGLSGGRSVEEVADAVVAELHRTGGFDREVLALMTTTGRGWVDEWSASSIEYLAGGDTAIAAMQYSYLPSIVALLTDRRTPAEAGRALLERVEAELATRPPGDRPRLVLGGESLGAFGGQSAFRDEADMLARIDGAVWVGTPGFTPIWRSMTDRRQGGSPEIAPVVDSGSHVRFATRPAELTADVYGRRFGPWEFPRVVYAQHASDPIPRWTAATLTDEPAWMQEPPGSDVLDVPYTSFVTFWQLTTDVAAANSTPAGHGHRYAEELVPAWAAVLDSPAGLDLDRVIGSIRSHHRPV